ncbi:PREDICTED: pro-FMRFamide-related neuropeptide FF [Chinchilla lanigera]|uniref:pro-FMRFamide-related neuropeptide FF n=1 Tax=Chinchilla lanigera TaxID=34839 RepID=UPI0006971F0E|nr:PREDICTED: pro-FMRFamide-related neuropeptide FF [Chinchilla lanigera]
MDSRRAAVLLVLLLSMAWAHAKGPGGQHGEQAFVGDGALTSRTYPWRSLPRPCDCSALSICHIPSPLPLPQEEDVGLHPPQRAQTAGSLLRSLLRAMNRTGRSPAFLFQPQRFGRNTWGSRNSERLSPRAGEFWSLAAPLRFGKK